MNAVVGSLRREGMSSTMQRARFELDWRWAQRRRRALPERWPSIGVLHVVASIAHPGRGGVERALLDRLAVSAPPWALLSLAGDGTNRAELHLCLEPGHCAGIVAPDLDAVAIVATAARLGARTVVIENLAPFDPASLLPLVEAPLRLVIALHDLGALCPRPHLFDAATHGYCAGSTDRERCCRCRIAAAEVQVDHQRWRSHAAQLLAGADAVVAASAWLRMTIERALPLPATLRWHEIAPATAPEVLPPAPPPGQRLGLLGALREEKGAAVARAALERLPGLQVAQFGPVHAEYAAWARRRLVRRGFHRPGRLGSELQRHRVGLALIGSIVPESHSLVADEAWCAGVPVLAFEHGALATRVGRDGPGALMPLPPHPNEATGVLVEALKRWQRGELDLLLPPPARGVRTPQQVARELAALIAACG